MREFKIGDKVIYNGSSKEWHGKVLTIVNYFDEKGYYVSGLPDRPNWSINGEFLLPYEEPKQMKKGDKVRLSAKGKARYPHAPFNPYDEIGIAGTDDYCTVNWKAGINCYSRGEIELAEMIAKYKVGDRVQWEGEETTVTRGPINHGDTFQYWVTDWLGIDHVANEVELTDLPKKIVPKRELQEGDKCIYKGTNREWNGKIVTIAKIIPSKHPLYALKEIPQPDNITGLWQCDESNLTLVESKYQAGDFAIWIRGKTTVKVKIVSRSSFEDEDNSTWYIVYDESDGIQYRAKESELLTGEEVQFTKDKQEEMAAAGAQSFNITIDQVTSDFMTKSVQNILDAKAAVYTAELQKKLQPQIIKIDAKEIVVDKTKHYMFKDVLYKCTVHKQAFLAGPTGSGKTTLAAQIAEAMGVPFYFISCSAGMSEAHLLGRMLFNGDYASSDLVRAYEGGGVFLFDEIDAADNNTLLVVNSALANNRLSLPNRKENPYAVRHANFICIVAGNSWGEGSIQYQGRTALDRAFLDRFAMSKANVDYDADLEKLITSKHPKCSLVFHNFRSVLKSKSIDRPISTRSIISAYKDMENGHDLKTILKNFIIGWSIDEKKQAETFMAGI